MDVMPWRGALRGALQAGLPPWQTVRYKNWSSKLCWAAAIRRLNQSIYAFFPENGGFFVQEFAMGAKPCLAFRSAGSGFLWAPVSMLDEHNMLAQHCRH